eukprot:GHRQ01007377.1.p2 GENE.GHRQ01007377.1~~GHRQ01007377.1.p2  ORF type:complete len:229 (+),score=11.20 GHRQ01007377.1:584-1270(+)
MANPTAKTHTIIHMLSGAHCRVESRATAARDTMTAHWEELTQHNVPTRAANTRTPCTGEAIQIQATRQTGYARYQALQRRRNKQSQSYIKEAHTICGRAYHHHCSAAPAGQQYTCEECIAQGYTTTTLPTALRLLLVEWHDTQEMADELCQSSCTQEAAEQLATVCQTQQEARPTKRAAIALDMSNIMPTAQERMYDVTIGQAIRRQLVIHTTAINPHTDISPQASAC